VAKVTPLSTSDFLPQEPSPTGKAKYPEDPVGFYIDLPCTCTPACPSACKGDACGCKACNANYNDDLTFPE
jgi:hypothetical protein